MPAALDWSKVDGRWGDLTNAQVAEIVGCRTSTATKRRSRKRLPPSPRKPGTQPTPDRPLSRREPRNLTLGHFTASELAEVDALRLPEVSRSARKGANGETERRESRRECVMRLVRGG